MGFANARTHVREQMLGRTAESGRGWRLRLDNAAQDIKSSASCMYPATKQRSMRGALVRSARRRDSDHLALIIITIIIIIIIIVITMIIIITIAIVIICIITIIICYTTLWLVLLLLLVGCSLFCQWQVLSEEADGLPAQHLRVIVLMIAIELETVTIVIRIIIVTYK